MQTIELIQDQIPCNRKIWQRKGEIRMHGLSPISVRTLDISIVDVSLLSPVHLAPGQSCSLNIPTFFRGTIKPLNLQGRIAYSILSGISGFRIGINFTGLNERSGNMLDSIIDGSYW